MTGAVKFLSDDALVKVAAYYGTLDPARPAAAPKPAAKGKAAAQTDPVLAGKAAAESCGGCHGDFGVSKTPGSPSLVGLDPKYLVAAINAYKTGQRKDDTMKALVAGLSDADVGQHRAVLRAAEAGARGHARRGRRGGGQEGRRRLRRLPRRHRGRLGPGESEPRRPGRAVPRHRNAGLQGRRAQGRDDEEHGRRARRRRDQEHRRVLRRAAAAGAQGAQAAQPRGTDRALRPLPRHQRQQHRSPGARRSPRSARTGWNRS